MSEPFTLATFLEGRESLAGAFREILTATIGDLTNGTEETPLRAAKGWQELTAGYQVDIASLFKTFDSEGYDEMICLKEIPFTSLCEHHLLPFIGEAHIVYLPSGPIVGLSKMARLVRAYSRRLQNQERFTQQIADAIVEHLNALGVLILVESHHTCMSARGVQSPGTMVTSVTRGAMRDKPEARDEALRLIGK